MYSMQINSAEGSCTAKGYAKVGGWEQFETEYIKLILYNQNSTVDKTQSQNYSSAFSLEIKKEKVHSICFSFTPWKIPSNERERKK